MPGEFYHLHARDHRQNDDCLYPGRKNDSDSGPDEALRINRQRVVVQSAKRCTNSNRNKERSPIRAGSTGKKVPLSNEDVLKLAVSLALLSRLVFVMDVPIGKLPRKMAKPFLKKGGGIPRRKPHNLVRPFLSSRLLALVSHPFADRKLL